MLRYRLLIGALFISSVVFAQDVDKKAAAVLKRYVKSTGLDKYRPEQPLEVKATMTLAEDGEETPINMTVREKPFGMRMSMVMEGVPMEMVLNEKKKKGWMAVMGQVMPMDPPMYQNMMQSANEFDAVRVLYDWENSAESAKYQGQQTIDGETVDVVFISAKGHSKTLYIAEKTGFLVRYEGQMTEEGQTFTERTDLKNYKNANGMKTAMQSEIYRDDVLHSTIKLTSVNYKVKYNSKLFGKP